MAETNIDGFSNEEKAAIVCLFFARLNSDDPRYKDYTSKLKILAQKYGVKYNTLKNNKDRFDAQFNNGRAGWYQTPIEKANKFLNKIYEQYKDMLIDEQEKIVNAIIAEAEEEGPPFFSIKTKDKKIVNAVLGKKNIVEFDGLNILKNSLTAGRPVFIVFGGDKPEWETGLAGMGIISKPPYDFGYAGKNYKIQVDVKLLLSKYIKREDLVPYKDTYDIIGIGPITKWEPNQAVSQIPEKNAVALMRAMLELNPDIEDDLKSIIGDSLMKRVKGAVTKFISEEVYFGENLSSGEDDEYEIEQAEQFAENFNPDINEMIYGLYMDRRPFDTLKNLINSGRHIIFNGPPGTGKTTLAERACEQAVKCRYVSGYLMTTATADWSTFDTIGGYMPDDSGRLIFQEGIFLRSIRENKWLIIDEINRAEVDKAFGQFFTVLSGKDVDLPYKTDTPDGRKNIKIKHSSSFQSYFNAFEAVYYVGRNWRILATMNTYDKNSLFMLSYAFMRRFSFVYVPIPSNDEFRTLISDYLSERNDMADKLLSVIKYSPKKLGAAIIIDLIKYLQNSDFSNLIDGICSLVVPQFEGISVQQVKKLYNDYGNLFDSSDNDIFRDYLCEFFDVNETELLKKRSAGGSNDSYNGNWRDDEREGLD